jgi:Pretoxin HINT domain
MMRIRDQRRKLEALIGALILISGLCVHGATFEPFAFVAGTKIAPDDRKSSIDKITEGDKVWSADTKTHRVSLKPVTQVSASDTEEMVEVQIFGGDKIDCTPEQPFWVELHGWKPAKSLFPGDLLEQRDGSHPKVYNIIFRKTKTHVYHLEVKDFHSYFAGPHGVLVAS